MALGRPALPSNLPVITSANDYRRQMARPQPKIVAGTPFNPFKPQPQANPFVAPKPVAQPVAQPRQQINPFVAPQAKPTPINAGPTNFGLVPQAQPVPNQLPPMAGNFGQPPAPPMTQFLQQLQQQPAPVQTLAPQPQPTPVQQAPMQQAPMQQAPMQQAPVNTAPPVAQPQSHFTNILQRSDGTWVNTQTGESLGNGPTPNDANLDQWGGYAPTGGISALAPNPGIASAGYVLGVNDGTSRYLTGGYA